METRFLCHILLSLPAGGAEAGPEGVDHPAGLPGGVPLLVLPLAPQQHPRHVRRRLRDAAALRVRAGGRPPRRRLAGDTPHPTPTGFSFASSLLAPPAIEEEAKEKPV